MLCAATLLTLVSVDATKPSSLHPAFSLGPGQGFLATHFRLQLATGNLIFDVCRNLERDLVRGCMESGEGMNGGKAKQHTCM